MPLFFLDEPKRKKQETPYLKLMKDATVFVAKHRKVRNILYYVSATSLAGFVGFMMYQPLLTDMGLRIEYLGIVILAIALAYAIGNKIAHRIEKRFGQRDLMFVFAGSRALLYLLVYLAGGYYLIIWALVIDFIAGASTPLVSDWINRCSKSENRATVLSLASMAGNLSFSIFSPLIGLAADIYDAQTTYLLLAILLGAYALRQLAVMVIGWKVRRTA